MQMGKIRLGGLQCSAVESVGKHAEGVCTPEAKGFSQGLELIAGTCASPRQQADGSAMEG